MSDSLKVKLWLGSEPVEVIVSASLFEGREITQRVVWIDFSSKIKDGYITHEELASGGRVIVNWGKVGAISYDAPAD
ncbi:hypothetical protein [Pseudolysinimonas sp.]|uniref:hypothetical protein n=1 Tax=Pseudolysinimonas sp. TaxID=2680009 RepID=UPI00286C3211|nr:hypothetical protein [Pseudolysinimonas sp.]